MDRPKLTQPRWQAGYDLALGRALAAMVRTEGYNAMLARAKQGMEFTKKSDVWKLVPSDNILSGSVLIKEAERAREYLDRVVNEHPGTPWALLASRELETPLGWVWEEEFRNLQAPMEQVAGDVAENRPLPSAGPPPKPLRKPPAL
jgi:hypothetical protein